MKVRVASRVTERRKTFEVKKLENFNKIREMLGLDGEYTTAHPQIHRNLPKIHERSAISKAFYRKTYFTYRNFANLSAIFCPRL